jgi:hypothetical protein
LLFYLYIYKKQNCQSNIRHTGFLAGNSRWNTETFNLIPVERNWNWRQPDVTTALLRMTNRTKAIWRGDAYTECTCEKFYLLNNFSCMPLSITTLGLIGRKKSKMCAITRRLETRFNQLYIIRAYIPFFSAKDIHSDSSRECSVCAFVFLFSFFRSSFRWFIAALTSAD